MSLRFDAEVELPRRARAPRRRTVTTAESGSRVVRARECSRLAARLGDCRVRIAGSGGDATAEEHVAVVERDDLAGRDPRLRLTRSTTRRAVEARGDRLAVRAHLRGQTSRASGIGPSTNVRSRTCDGVAQQVVAPPEVTVAASASTSTTYRRSPAATPRPRR